MILDDRSLVDKIAPAIVDGLNRRKESIISSGSVARKLILKAAWDDIIDQIPDVTHDALRAIREEFGHISVNDLIDWIGKDK